MPVVKFIACLDFE